MSELSEPENIPVTAVEILASVMTEAEAQQCIEEINSNINRIRLLLVELESREGYAALGFANMSQLMQSDLFTKARSTLQKELQAGRIERHHLNVPIGTFSESHLRPFTKLKPDYYKQAVDKAFSIAGIRPVAAKDMSQAVAELMCSHPDAAKRGIVERLKEKPLLLASDYCKQGEVFFLQRLTGTELKYNGCWAIAIEVENRFTVKAAVYKEVLEVKQENMKRIDSEQSQAEIKEIYECIKRLMECQLDPIDEAQIEVLCRRPWFTPRQKQALNALMMVYGVEHE